MLGKKPQKDINTFKRRYITINSFTERANGKCHYITLGHHEVRLVFLHPTELIGMRVGSGRKDKVLN